MLFACSKETTKQDKSETTSQKTKTKETKTHPTKEKESGEIWYYFVKNNRGNLRICQSTSINSIPKTDFLPWTESVRLTSIGLMYEKPILLINRGGIIAVTDIKNNAEFESPEVFTQKTIDGFYKTNIGVLIRAYTDIIFSELPENIDQKKNYCIYRYNSINKKLISIIDTESLNLAKKAQLTKLVYGKNGKKWLASFKTEIHSKVDFNYIEFENFAKLKNKEFSEMSHEDFINKTKTEKFSRNDIEDFKRKILENKHKNIRLEIFKKDNPSKIVYVKESTQRKSNINNDTESENDLENNEEEKEITAVACEFNNSINNKYKNAILFSNGELFYSKDGKRWNEERLEKLPKNFVYTYFVIYKDEIWAAWEEQNFFQVGRAGILQKKLK